MGDGDRVWRAALPQQTHEWAVVPEDEPDGFEFDRAIGLLPERQGSWEPIPMEVVSPSAERCALRAAMPWWSGSKNVLVLRDEAVESVGPVLTRHGELLPLAGRNADLVLFCAPVLDGALVESDSDLHRSVGSVCVRLDRGAFDSGLVGDQQAFVVRVGRGLDLMLTEPLVREIQATGDTSGVRFEHVGQLR